VHLHLNIGRDEDIYKVRAHRIVPCKASHLSGSGAPFIDAATFIDAKNQLTTVQLDAVVNLSQQSHFLSFCKCGPTWFELS